MPKRADFILQFRVQNIEDFSPEAVVKSPRTFRPLDVRKACANVALDAPAGTPPAILSLCHFIAIDFIALAHVTGLFNRQIKLWEALGKAASVEVFQATRGLFVQQKLSEYDLCFYDQKKRLIALGHFAEASGHITKFDYLKSSRAFLKRVTQDAQGASGVFLCYPGPFPSTVLEHIKKATKAHDKIARFESVIPSLGVPVNLLELEHSPVFDPTQQVKIQKIRLIHPDLRKKKAPATSFPAVDLNEMESGPLLLAEQESEDGTEESQFGSE